MTVNKMSYFFLIGIFVGWGVSCLIWADEVVTKSGDILHGKVSAMRDGVVTLETTYGDPVNVKMAELKSLKTDEPINVGFVDFTNMKGTVEVKDDSIVISAPDGDYEASLADVKTLGDEVQSPYPKFGGEVQFDYNYKDGNTELMRLGFRVKLTLVTERSEGIIRGWGDFQEDNKEETIRKTRFLGKYLYFLAPVDPHLYLDVLGLIEYDYFQHLKRRTREGGGVGYRFLQTENTLFQTEIGAVYTQETYRKRDKDRDFGSPFFSEDFEQKISLIKAELIQHFEIFPRFSTLSDYVMRTEAALRFPITEILFFEFGVIQEHTSRPPKGIRKKDDVTVSASLGARF